MIPVVVLGNGNLRLIIRILVAAKPRPLGPGITRKELQSVAESFLQLGLQGVVVHMLKRLNDCFYSSDSERRIYLLTFYATSRQAVVCVVARMLVNRERTDVSDLCEQIPAQLLLHAQVVGLGIPADKVLRRRSDTNDWWQRDGTGADIRVLQGRKAPSQCR